MQSKQLYESWTFNYFIVACKLLLNSSDSSELKEKPHNGSNLTQYFHRLSNAEFLFLL